jgi:hypothetical protein
LPPGTSTNPALVNSETNWRILRGIYLDLNTTAREFSQEARRGFKGRRVQNHQRLYHVRPATFLSGGVFAYPSATITRFIPKIAFKDKKWFSPFRRSFGEPAGVQSGE